MQPVTGALPQLQAKIIQGTSRGALKEMAVCSPMCADACTLFRHFSCGLPVTWIIFC